MTATTTTPLYVQFAAALKQKCAELGLKFEECPGTETGFPQNEGYFFVRTAPGQAAMIVPKSKTRMANVHLHIDLTGVEGHVQLPKKNGKVLGHFVPDLDLIAEHVLPRLPGASKRATIIASRATVSAPVEAPVSWAQFDMGEEGELAGEMSDGEQELQTAGSL